MREEKVKIYKFDELSETAKEKAINANISINEDTINYSMQYAVETLVEKGIKLGFIFTYEDINFKDIGGKFPDVTIKTKNLVHKKYLLSDYWDFLPEYFGAGISAYMWGGIRGNVKISNFGDEIPVPLAKKLNHLGLLFSKCLNQMESAQSAVYESESIAETIMAMELEFTEDGRGYYE